MKYFLRYLAELVRVKYFLRYLAELVRVKFFLRYLAELVRVKFFREGEIFSDVPRGTREGVMLYLMELTRW